MLEISILIKPRILSFWKSNNFIILGEFNAARKRFLCNRQTQDSHSQDLDDTGQRSNHHQQSPGGKILSN
jgi:hypothetical protein